MEGYFKNGESVLEKVELDKENILEKKKTLEENYKNQSKKIIQIEANVGSLKETSKTYASTVEMLRIVLGETRMDSLFFGDQAFEKEKSKVCFLYT